MLRISFKRKQGRQIIKKTKDKLMFDDLAVKRDAQQYYNRRLFLSTPDQVSFSFDLLFIHIPKSTKHVWHELVHKNAQRKQIVPRAGFNQSVKAKWGSFTAAISTLSGTRCNGGSSMCKYFSRRKSQAPGPHLFWKPMMLHWNRKI